MKKVLTLAAAGRLGGKARAKVLTPQQRQEIARNAINARWERVRQNGNAPTFAALVPGTDFAQSQGQTKKRNAAALETETELAESTSSIKKK